MNANTERSAQSPAPSGKSPTEPERKTPQHLWEILEEEMIALYGTEIDLDQTYKDARDAAIAKARQELRVAIEERPTDTGRKLTPQELDAKLEKEIEDKPQLINGPACKELFQRVHRFVEAHPRNAARHSALCLSGGGIRSATFALGVLQGLASKRVLPDFAYLSTVSGGGYIGGWLSSWICRERARRHEEDPQGDKKIQGEQSLTQVANALSKPEKPASHLKVENAVDRDPKQPFETEPKTIQHLRAFSNYLTPALGLLSGDGWAVAATVARNLLLNWLLIIPALLLVLLAPRISLSVELAPLGKDPAMGVACAVAGFLCGVYALANLLARRGKNQWDVLLHCILPIVSFSAFATLAWYWARSANPAYGFFRDPTWRQAFYVGWGAVTALLAVPLSVLIRWYQGLEIPKDWVVRLVCLVVVFGLTGLAAWWFSDKASAWMVRAADLEASATADAGPAPAKRADAPTGPIWALVSRDKEDSKLAAWVKVDSDKVPAQNWAEEFFTGPQATTALEFRLKTATMCVCCGFPLLLALIFIANTVLTGLLSHRMHDKDREWLARASGWAFLLALVCGGVNLLVLHGPVWLVALWGASPKLLSSVAGGSGLLTIFGGQSDKMAASDKADEDPKSKDWILAGVVKFAAPIFVIVLLMLFSLVTTLLLQKLDLIVAALMRWQGSFSEVDPARHWQLLSETTGIALVIAAAIFAVIALFSTYGVNINKFSLHSMYRNRLIRAYLGATNRKRHPNLFTGFDEKDNVDMQDLQGQRPMHVLNIALNLVSGTDLAWQQRLATSFTVTPFVSGSATLGYRESAWYGRGSDASSRGISLGTALSISGAAVSPNHGYNSSPLIAFILAFFNARLGGWFGNPGVAGDDTWTKSSPKSALPPIVAEAFGLTDSTHPYVYLSDGGHFENLGLYEMVLRRCRIIVVSDAGCDPNYFFEDLGNAIAKIRVDFGISIDFKPNIDIRKYTVEQARAGKVEGHHCAVGRIHYSDVDGFLKEGPEGPEDRDGWLIYVKAAMCGKEPMDVFHYFCEHPDFPHEPTTDQWFSESQFESYRILGTHCIEEICATKSAKADSASGLEAFWLRAVAHVTKPSGEGSDAAESSASPSPSSSSQPSTSLSPSSSPQPSGSSHPSPLPSSSAQPSSSSQPSAAPKPSFTQPRAVPKTNKPARKRTDSGKSRGKR